MYSKTKPAKVRSGKADSLLHQTSRGSIRQELSDPAAANHDISIVEDRRLPGRDGALGLVELNEDFVVSASFDHGCGRFVTMANLHRHPHGLAQLLDRDEVH